MFRGISASSSEMPCSLDRAIDSVAAEGIAIWGVVAGHTAATAAGTTAAVDAAATAGVAAGADAGVAMGFTAGLSLRHAAGVAVGVAARAIVCIAAGVAVGVAAGIAACADAKLLGDSLECNACASVGVAAAGAVSCVSGCATVGTRSRFFLELQAQPPCKRMSTKNSARSTNTNGDGREPDLNK
uniref:Uncharacterized protein n=1 Tax=Coccolithus braarudii TaxID=221442 RepID=A0A7S0Q2K4_9EUKA|eukprot:CAMPEP_0183336266 /NCGR_PEP_ID=MMETSP0164_2-20130417/4290_1 /TAXON_ID=221442 /ORGANISM="Coccolithus pelagicus ssp braarudi, Strain PLY182g" /LENGTH=184 /DNA_ID=CAMNT_0025505749 /DNA_START=298 /DNA_END=852 /DNA_ORIENTATION=+